MARITCGLQLCDLTVYNNPCTRDEEGVNRKIVTDFRTHEDGNPMVRQVYKPVLPFVASVPMTSHTSSRCVYLLETNGSSTQSAWESLGANLEFKSGQL